MDEILGVVDPDILRSGDFDRPSPELIHGYRDLSPGDVAGRVARALDTLGVAGTVPAAFLGPMRPGEVLIGPAFTIRNVPERNVPYRSWQEGARTALGEREAFFLVQVGDVVVIEGSTIFPASCLGPMSLTVAQRLGVAGIVVSGAVTGVAGIRQVDIPVWARAGTTVTGHHRIETIEINGPIGIRGVRVEPGDLVVADDSGVTFVPAPLIEEVLRLARASEEHGAQVRALLKQGSDRESLRSELARFMKGISGQQSDETE